MENNDMYLLTLYVKQSFVGSDLGILFKNTWNDNETPIVNQLLPYLMLLFTGSLLLPFLYF